MQRYHDLAVLLLRLATAFNFLSAVASRLGFWGLQSSGWKNFIDYAGEVNSFAPAWAVPFLAVTATSLEIVFAILLLVGYRTRWAALGSGVLTLFFALAMSFSFGIKSALDYSVFVDSTSAFLLATLPYYRYSFDAFLSENKKSKTVI